MKKIFTLQNIARIISLSFGIALIMFLTIANLAPFGVSTFYTNKNPNHISKLSPSTRVLETKIKNDLITKQIGDLVYFTTNMPFHFDTADVKITYQNIYSDQNIELGFQDDSTWHYDTKLISTPLIDSLSWMNVGVNPTLYQRNNKYKSINLFLSNPPKDSLIGVYNYEKEIFDEKNFSIRDYVPSKHDTMISTPLRGAHTFYVYLDKEAFKLSISKQDLNWYEGEDYVEVKIYKGKDLVYQTTLEDDGIADNSHRTRTTQTSTINNPGPELPESGIYKIVLNASNDTIITKITTNLHKIIAVGQLFLAENTVYSPVIKKTNPTSLYTNALIISGKTSHKDNLQDIQLDDDKLSINFTGEEYATTSSSLVTNIIVPKNDIILKGQLGYFAFSEDQLFRPSKHFVIPISDSHDLATVDYVITDYKRPKSLGNGWFEATTMFDLSEAFINNGRLNWIIKAPGLKENNRYLYIKSIEIKLTKKPLHW